MSLPLGANKGQTSVFTATFDDTCFCVSPCKPHTGSYLGKFLFDLPLGRLDMLNVEPKDIRRGFELILHVGTHLR